MEHWQIWNCWSNLRLSYSFLCYLLPMCNPTPWACSNSNTLVLRVTVTNPVIPHWDILYSKVCSTYCCCWSSFVCLDNKSVKIQLLVLPNPITLPFSLVLSGSTTGAPTVGSSAWRFNWSVTTVSLWVEDWKETRKHRLESYLQEVHLQYVDLY